MKYCFHNDYSSVAHPRILTAVAGLGGEHNIGYGEDPHCRQAAEILRRDLKNSDVDIHFLPGGTITNLCTIAHILKPYEAVIAASDGHISIHETGAIEATGHKVLSVDTPDGKLKPEQIEKVMKQHENEHWVLPRMVYVSQATEFGTVYSKEELENLYQFCREHDLYVFVDGARLAAALVTEEADMELADMVNLSDAFYIGGTKAGLLFGEALVIVNNDLKHNFRFQMKQRGGLFAKGYLLGVQFEVFFKEKLYLEIGAHENRMAGKLGTVFEEQGFPMYVALQTNQIFPVVSKSLAKRLGEEYAISIWKELPGEQKCVRLVTSWATTEIDIQIFQRDLERMIRGQ